ncbi:MAG: (2Fe-2S) ferredoxin domain-containing protein [Thermostichus sp. DG02_2_bins_29]
MDRSHHKQGIPFQLEGQFLGFMPSADGKLKYLCWQTGSDLLVGKIPKAIRSELYRTLKPGDVIHIWGAWEVDLRKGQEKWVLYRVEPSSTEPPPPTLRTGPSLGNSDSRPKGAVLVCQKSDCCRRGAGAVIQALNFHLASYPHSIRVQGVGCMKACKQGPNVVFMPDKARYSGVSPQRIPDLLERHFPSSAGAAPDFSAQTVSP